MPAPIELSFARYVAVRKEQAAAREREGAGYAYAADLRARGVLARLRPVGLALEAATRSFLDGPERRHLIDGAVRVGELVFPRVHDAVAAAARTLGLLVPAAYVSPSPAMVEVSALGTGEDPLLFIPGRLVDQLSEPELKTAVGRALGQVQNGHVPLLTAMHVLGSAGGDEGLPLLKRWAAKPALAALETWAASAAVTADRAGLLVARDLGVAESAIIKCGLGQRTLIADVDVAAFRASVETATGRDTELARRIRALRLFARTAYFRGVMQGAGGTGEAVLSKDECDEQTARLWESLS